MEEFQISIQVEVLSTEPLYCAKHVLISKPHHKRKLWSPWFRCYFEILLQPCVISFKFCISYVPSPAYLPDCKTNASEQCPAKTFSLCCGSHYADSKIASFIQITNQLRKFMSCSMSYTFISVWIQYGFRLKSETGATFYNTTKNSKHLYLS